MQIDKSVAKRCVWIETDLEPDDILSIYLLAKAGLHPNVIVTGEGDAAKKEARMCSYLEMLDKEKLMDSKFPTLILRGQGSKRLFDKDGQEFTQLHLASDEQKQDKDAYVKALSSYLNTVAAPLMIVLKPPRELLRVLSDKQLNPELLGKCKLWMYGSFNLRCIMFPEKDDNAKGKQEPEFIRHFKTVRLYESFHATGQENNIHEKNMPDVYASLGEMRKQSAYLATLFRLIYLWNSHIVEEAQQDMKRHQLSGATERQQRSAKIVETVKPYIATQMVLADFGLIAAALDVHLGKNWMPVKVTWDARGYSSLENQKDSKVYVCCGVKWSDMQNALLALLQGKLTGPSE